MPQHLRDLYTAEMAAARAAQENDERWRRLERAHVVSQPFPWPHTRNHVAAPGSALVRYPEGNTGRTRVGLMASSLLVRMAVSR